MKKIICKQCKKKTSLQDWDDFTKSLCTNREARRKYVSIEKCKKQDLYYACPKCKNMARGVDLKIVEEED